MLVKKKPKHIALTMGGNLSYSRRHNLPIEGVYSMVFSKINDMISMQTGIGIPIITLNVLTSKAKSFENYPNIMDVMVYFFEKLRGNKIVSENKVKISVLGKWYDLPGRVVEPIKAVIDETRDYDNYFMNLCINYDGKEEIVDACKMLGRKIQAGKLDPDSISQESIKENVYSSYFMPPDLIIKTGKSKRLKGFLLWDSTNSHVYFTGKSWLEITRDDINRAIEEWNREMR